MSKNSNNNNKELDALLDTFPGIIYRRFRDESGMFRYEFLTDTIYKILNINKGDEIVVSPNGYLDVVHWADRYELSQQIAASIQDLQPYQEKFRIVNSQGQIRWLKGEVIPHKRDDGTVMWEGMLIDITKTKQAYQQLDIVLENTADSILSLDEDGFIVSANSAVTSMFGYEEEELLGKNVSMLLVPSDRDECEEYIRSYLGSDGLADKSKNFEFIGQMKDGDDFPIAFTISTIRIEGRLSFIVIMKDIKEQKETLATLKETETRLSTIVSALPCVLFTMIISSEDTFRILYMSEGSADVFGFTPDQLYNNQSKYADLIFNHSKLNAYRAKLFSTKMLTVFDDEIKISYKNHWIQIRTKPELLDDGEILCHGVIIDVTERREAAERIKYLAYHDTLTDAANRALLVKELNTMIDLAQDNNDKIAVLSISPSNLNLFYSSAGHDIGDSLLAVISKTIKHSIGPHNFLAYTSGNLFVAALPNASSEEKIIKVIDKITDAFNSPLIVNDQSFDITVNVGVALFPEHGSDTNTLIRNSNAALDLAKKDFNDYKFFTEEISQSIANAISLRSRLRQALENGDIVPYFQPQIDIKTGRIVGTEALARWIDRKTGSLISPGVFIPIAEEYGLIDHIAACILEKACYHNQQWIKQGILSIPVAVNISPRQFRNSKDLMKMIETVLANTGLPPDKLEIELTESSTMANPKEAEDVIKHLLSLGITCSIDDFGTGYSSLSVLKRFPLNKIKIDRSFVIDIAHDQNDASIVSATIAMARALNLKVLAEGVETKDIYHFLKKMGCNSIQGYLFSKALPPDELVKFALSWNPDEILSQLDVG